MRTIESAEPADRRTIEEVLNLQAVFSSDAEATPNIFQFTIHLTVEKKGGGRTQFRFIAQREGDRVAVLLLSPEGYPRALLVDSSFKVVGDGSLQFFADGRFACYVGNSPTQGIGVNFTFERNQGRRSYVLLDLAAFTKPFRVPDAEYHVDDRNRSVLISTPRGAHVRMYLNAASAGNNFPIRALATRLKARDGDSNIEMYISDIHVGDLPWSLFEMAGGPAERGVPEVEVPYDELTTSPPLSDLGMSSPEPSPAARRLGLDMLRRFRRLDGDSLSTKELAKVEALVGLLSDDSVLISGHALKQLWSAGSVDVWGLFESGFRVTSNSPSYAETMSVFVMTGSGYHLGYDRFASASRTEMVYGPDIARELRRQLIRLIVNREIPLEPRCDALDLLGHFGLPLGSPLWQEIVGPLESEQVEELLASLAAFRVRHSEAGDVDLQRLHKVVSERRLSAPVITQGIEALAIVNELGQHAELLPSLLEADAAEPGVTRRMRAVAADSVGQKMLIDLLVAKSDKIQPRSAFLALEGACPTDCDQWPRLLQLGRDTAFDTLSEAPVRAAANDVVAKDLRALTTQYMERFWIAAETSGDDDLIRPALRNFVRAGRSDRCFRLLKQRLADGDAKRHKAETLLLPTLVYCEWTEHEQISPACWECLDSALDSADPQIRYSGTLAGLVLNDCDTPIPDSFIAGLVRAGLRDKDPSRVGLISLSLMGLTELDYTAPFPLENGKVTAETRNWISDNLATVHEHLRTWHATWDKRPRPDDTCSNQIE